MGWIYQVVVEREGARFVLITPTTNLQVAQTQLADARYAQGAKRAEILVAETPAELDKQFSLFMQGKPVRPEPEPGEEPSAKRRALALAALSQSGTAPRKGYPPAFYPKTVHSVTEETANNWQRFLRQLVKQGKLGGESDGASDGAAE